MIKTPRSVIFSNHGIFKVKMDCQTESADWTLNCSILEKKKFLDNSYYRFQISKGYMVLTPYVKCHYSIDFKGCTNIFINWQKEKKNDDLNTAVFKIECHCIPTN
jgi:hypothetical protein